MALAIKTPELFNKKEFERLMKVKNVVMKKMYKEYVKKRNKFKASSNATRHNLFTEIEKNKKNKSPSSRVGPPNKVKGSKLQG